MKIQKLISALSAVTLLTSAMPVPVFAEESALLDATKFMIRDENLVYLGADYLNDASILFNDQDKVPASPEQTNVNADLWNATDRNNWKPNWQAEFGDDAFYIDLNANYKITGICFLDTNGVQTWTIQSGEPYHWQDVTSFETDAYQTWRSIIFETPVETRYLRFVTACGDSGISELALYGYQISDLTEEQKARNAAKPSGSQKSNLTAGQKIGFNAFIDDPMTAIFAGGNVREYHNFNWLYDDAGKVKFTQGTWGDMDAYYQAMKNQNISIIPCFQGGSSYISGADKPEIAVPQGADTLDPASYALHAQALYQVAARYGSNQNIDANTLNVSDHSEIKTGLGLLDTLENSNEPNKTWSGKANYFSPQELAAMCSADYDGHEGTISNAGVKAADPNFKLAMGGLLNTASVLDYLSEMKLWFDYHRTDGKFAVDVINIHMGADTANPEESSLKSNIQKIQNWIKENAPGTELWISEFEIPMSDCETDGLDNHDNALYQKRYAQRTARTYLTAISADIDRMTKFQLRDEGEGVYYNSGLTTGKGEWSKKLAWYYVACMTTVLENADFTADLSENGICNYEFTDRTTGEKIYCLWSPTSEDKVIPDYKLKMNANYAYLTEPGIYAEGVVSELPISDGSVTIAITETPVFVTASASKKQIINGKGKRITPETIISDNMNQFSRMFDEQDTMPEYIYSDTAGLNLPETNVTVSGQTCYVQLDQSYILTGFGVYDTYGTGSLEIYDANTDLLLWSTDMGGYMSRSISLTADSAPTDKLKIIKGGGDLNELAFYGYPAPESIQMDVNADGAFNLLDIITMQKWLLNDGTTLADWKAGDCDQNQKINIYDLILMKKALLK